MQIKNINKKILAGLLGITILTTPLGFTACKANHKIDEQNNRYDIVKNYEVITLETDSNQTVWLTKKVVERLGNVIYYDYYDVFTGKIIYDEETRKRGIELKDEKYLQQYLINNDYVQSNYTEEELKTFLKKIEQNINKEKKNVKVKK